MTPSTQQRINELWSEHNATPLPDACIGQMVNGLDLEELDLELSACIDTILTSSRIDRERAIVLSVCRDKLSRVGGGLNKEASVYFHRLRVLALLIVEEYV